MGNNSNQLPRGSIISKMVIDKLGNIKKTSKAFRRSLHLLDIAELGAIIIEDSNIEIWKNFVDGVFEMNGGSIEKVAKLVGPGFRLLVHYFDLRSDILIDNNAHLDYQFTHNKRTVKVKKEKIKIYRQNNKTIIFDENDLFSLLKEFENQFKFFSEGIENAKNRKPGTPPPPKRSITIHSSIFERLFDKLSLHFEDEKDTLRRILDGKQSTVKLTVPFNQNQFADLFLRLKENGLLTNNKIEIKAWICDNFNRKDGTPFNETSVYDLLKKKSRVSKNSRIFKDLISGNLGKE